MKHVQIPHANTYGVSSFLCDNRDLSKMESENLRKVARTRTRQKQRRIESEDENEEDEGEEEEETKTKVLVFFF